MQIVYCILFSKRNTQFKILTSASLLHSIPRKLGKKIMSGDKILKDILYKYMEIIYVQCTRTLYICEQLNNIYIQKGNKR